MNNRTNIHSAILYTIYINRYEDANLAKFY